MRLSRGERRVFEALLRSAARGSKVPPDVEASRAIFERVLERGHKEARIAYRCMLFVFEWLPFVFGSWRSPIPFSRRSPEGQARYIERIVGSRSFIRRSIFKALSAAVLMSHYARPEVQRAVGYDALALNTHYRSIPRAPEAG